MNARDPADHQARARLAILRISRTRSKLADRCAQTPAGETLAAKHMDDTPAITPLHACPVRTGICGKDASKSTTKGPVREVQRRPGEQTMPRARREALNDA